LEQHPFFRHLWKVLNQYELMALGGQVTYYMILSFFPLLIFFFTLAGFADVSSENIFEELKYLLPRDAYKFVESIIYEILATRSPTLLSFGMLATAWASTNGILSLMRGIGKAYGFVERRSIFRLLPTAFIVLFILTLSVILSLLIQFSGRQLGLHLFPVFSQTALFAGLWSAFRLLILFIILAVDFMILNRIGTNSQYPWRRLLPGSLLAAAGWIVISLGSSLYFTRFSTFTLTYGSIGGIMVLLLWLYWSLEILLLGCAVNAVLAERKGSKAS